MALNFATMKTKAFRSLHEQGQKKRPWPVGFLSCIEYIPLFRLSIFSLWHENGNQWRFIEEYQVIISIYSNCNTVHNDAMKRAHINLQVKNQKKIRIAYHLKNNIMKDVHCDLREQAQVSSWFLKISVTADKQEEVQPSEALTWNCHRKSSSKAR